MKNYWRKLKSLYCRQIIIFILLIPYNVLGQTRIGKTEGAEILLNKNYYEIIFMTDQNKFSSFYIKKETEEKYGLKALKKYVFLLFKNQQGKDYLLQFLDDSILLVYKNNKVQMIKWKDHNGDKRKCSQWFSYSNFLELFGMIQKKGTF